MRFVFAPETQLTVYVDGKYSADLSDSYSYGDKATITAPEVSGKTFSYWMADGSVISSAQTLSITSVSGTEATVGAKIEGIIAAETPLLVYNGTEQAQTVTLIPTMEAATASVTWAEAFKGTAKDSTFTAADMQAADYYALSGGKAFAKVYGAGTLSAHLCWLQFDKQQQPGARQIDLVFGNETSISLTSLTPDPSRG